MKYLLMVELTREQIGFVRDMFDREDEFADSAEFVKEAVKAVKESCEEILSC